MNKDDLKNKIVAANSAYRSGTPIMSDQAFDDLCDEYQKLVSEDEWNVFRDSLHEDGGKVKHPFIMGSLDKIKHEDKDEVIKFVKSLGHKINVSAKVDGISCRASYKNGVLVSATTRGDGWFGQNITDKASFIKGLPSKLFDTVEHLPIDDEDFEIRGELVILREDFARLNEKHNNEFANARNACAGIMNRKDWNKDDVSCISFVPYTILGDEYTKHEQFLCLSMFEGMNPAWNVEVDVDSMHDIPEQLFAWASQSFSYETDGLVICSADYRNEDKYRPDACKAFKINQQVATTKLVDVVFEGPAKNGTHTPVAILDPVDLGGAMISRVSLYNIDFIKEKRLKYGSVVEIVRSGDVIPKITRVVKNDESCKDIVLPEHCNCCGAKLVQDGVNLRCANKDCIDQVVSQLVLFIKNLGVKSASHASLKKFGITSFAKLVDFQPDKKYKSEMKLADELSLKMFSRSKHDLLCNMTCFGGLAETTLAKIIDFYASKGENIDNFMIPRDPTGYALNKNMKSLLVERHGLPDGIGEITLDKFQDGLEEAYNNLMLIVDSIKYTGQNASAGGSMLTTKRSNGQSVCFTGALNTMSRNEASQKAQDAGFEVKSGVSKGLTYLVTNNIDSGSSKARKAKTLGIAVISEDEFIKMISNESCDINAF